MTAALEASGEYRVVRRLRTPDPLLSSPAGARLGLVIDVETTGAGLRGDEVIELAMVSFAYTPEGEVLGVVDTFQGYHEPTRAISAEITALTGFSAETVAGHALDPEAVGAFVAPAVIVLAHNAAFDRRFAERLHPYFSTKAWGCTMSEPPWREEGFEGLKLAYLASQSGVFSDKHRALHDCHDTLHLLSRPLPASGRTALAHLLERARRPSFRLWAESAPFEHKDTLNGRDYRWSGGEDGGPRGLVDRSQRRRPGRRGRLPARARLRLRGGAAAAAGQRLRPLLRAGVSGGRLRSGNFLSRGLAKFGSETPDQGKFMLGSAVGHDLSSDGFACRGGAGLTHSRTSERLLPGRWGTFAGHRSELRGSDS